VENRILDLFFEGSIVVGVYESKLRARVHSRLS